MRAVRTTLRLLLAAMRRRSAVVLPVLFLHGLLLWLLVHSRPQPSAIRDGARPPMAVHFIEAVAISPRVTRSEPRQADGQTDGQTKPPERKPASSLRVSRSITPAAPVVGKKAAG